MNISSKIVRFLVPETIPGFAARLYDLAARTAVEPYFKQVAAEIAASIGSGIILDVGTGPGYLPVEVARLRPGVRVVGIDQTKKMIDIARRNAAEANVSAQLDFEKGNAYRLRFGDDSFDMVVSTGTLHSWKDPVRAINECYRVLKPGAEAWIYDPALVSSGIDFKSWRKTLGFWDRLVLKWVSITSRIVPQSLTVSQAQDIVSKTKFNNSRIKGNADLRIKLRK